MQPSTYSNLVKERLELFDTIVKKGFELKTGRLWMIEPSQMRFRIGDSIKDLKIPYSFGGEDESTIEKCILALVTFLKRRLETDSAHATKEGLPLLLDIKTTLIEKTYRIDYFLPDSVEKNVACEILTATPIIDSGILKEWLGPGGHGKAYYVLAKGILQKAALEEIQSDGMEKTSCLAVMAIVNATLKKKEGIIRNIKIKGLNYERIDQVVGLALYFVFKTAVKTVLSELKQITQSYSDKSDSSMEEWFTPRSFIAIQGNIINSDLNPYGIPMGIASSLQPLYSDAISKASDAAQIIEIMGNEIKRRGPLIAELVKFSQINHARRIIREYLLHYDLFGLEGFGSLAEMYTDNRLIHALFTDSKFMNTLNKELDKVKTQFQKDTGRVEKINAIQEFIASVKKTTFGDLIGVGKKKDITDIIKGFVAYRFDEEIEKFVGPMRGLLVDRRGEFSPETLRVEYERGRLYRFSTDQRPILRGLEIEEEGYLFVDMKDFTRKTLKAKEITMADFMASHFYEPILKAASRYGSSAPGIGDDKKSIRLHNLIGDAIVFSGGVTNLIALAGDILLVMKRYKEQLEKRTSHIAEEELLRNVHKNFEAMKQEFEREYAEVDRAITAGTKGLEGRLMELKEKEQRFEKAYRAELEGAIGKEMEAGLFITYGRKAEIIEMKDDFWGEVKVAIGEKINEAARGAYRSLIVWAKMERLLEGERMKRHNRDIKYPFNIYIDKTYGLLMPQGLDRQLEDMITHKDLSKAKDMVQLLAQESFKDMRKIVSGEPLSSSRILTTTSDIYNRGQALTEDALHAYMKENKGKGFFFKREVKISELNEEIQKIFFFPANALELWFVVFSPQGAAKQAEIFCRVGEITFKGFEATTPSIVYEIVNRDSLFFKLLLMHHFDPWYEEAQKK